jgi:hypothetical protein
VGLIAAGAVVGLANTRMSQGWAVALATLWALIVKAALLPLS